MNKNRKINLKGTLIVVGALAAFNAQAAKAASAPALDPEVVSSTWEEGEQECASVSINGDEIIAYRGSTTNGSAESKAQSLAEKLDSILKSSESIENLMPARDGCFAALKANGKTLLKFEPAVPVADNDDGTKVAIKSSLQVINALRAAKGASKLPDAVVKFAEASASGRLAVLDGVDDCFSGQASWYGPGFHGRKTSNGERFNQDGMTAAHRTLPFGTKLLVTNRSTGKSCVVKVNDRGPYCDNRVIDLSHGAAKQLNMVSSGVAMVDVFVLQ